MAHNDFTKLYAFTKLPDFTKLFDVKALLDIQRKNILAFSEARKLAVEGLQAVARRQTEILSQIAGDNSSMLKEIMNESTPEEKVLRHADLATTAYEKSVANWREFADMIAGAGKEASDIINGRVISSLTECKSALDKSGKSSVQKKAA